jgi:hypothetical protein
LNLLRFVILCILHLISKFSDERKSWIYSKGRGKTIFSHGQNEITYTTALPLKHLPSKGRGQNLPRKHIHSVITKRKSKAEKRRAIHTSQNQLMNQQEGPSQPSHSMAIASMGPDSCLLGEWESIYPTKINFKMIFIRL